MGCCAACAPIFHTGGMKMNVFELFGTIAIKNRDANAAIQDTTNKAERAGTKIQAAFKKIGEASIKIAKPIIAGATAIGTAYAAAIETTRDYRTAMAQLETTFITNGHSADTAKKTYQDLQAILGDTDKAVEAATALALMTDNEEDLAKWTDICMAYFQYTKASSRSRGWRKRQMRQRRSVLLQVSLPMRSTGRASARTTSTRSSRRAGLSRSGKT